MSAKRNRSPSESPPELALPWLGHGRSLVQALATSPARSSLLQSSTRAPEVPLHTRPVGTPAQELRLQIAESVK